MARTRSRVMARTRPRSRLVCPTIGALLCVLPVVGSSIATGGTRPTLPAVSREQAGARAALESVRRATAHATEAADVVTRYDRLLGQIADFPEVVADAETDRAVWADRVERGLLRLGEQWVTPDERDQIAVNRLSAAVTARDLIRQGRYADAERLVGEALRLDPADVSALYLDGLIRLREGDTRSAEARFTAVRSAVPGHAPTLNNLASIYARNPRPDRLARAVRLLSEAMAAEPVNRPLLDNAAELLHLLDVHADARLRAGRPVRQLVELFESQDATLAARLASQGLWRWGSTWVDAARRAELDAAKRAYDERVASLRRDYDSAEAELNRLTRDVERNERVLQQMERDSVLRTPDGRLVYRPLPPAYYEVQAELTRSRGEAEGQRSRLESLRVSAAEASAMLPVPPFAGRLEPIGEDGVPVLVGGE